MLKPRRYLLLPLCTQSETPSATNKDTCVIDVTSDDHDVTDDEDPRYSLSDEQINSLSLNEDTVAGTNIYFGSR